MCSDTNWRYLGECKGKGWPNFFLCQLSSLAPRPSPLLTASLVQASVEPCASHPSRNHLCLPARYAHCLPYSHYVFDSLSDLEGQIGSLSIWLSCSESILYGSWVRQGAIFSQYLFNFHMDNLSGQLMLLNQFICMHIWLYFLPIMLFNNWEYCSSQIWCRPSQW